MEIDLEKWLCKGYASQLDFMSHLYTKRKKKDLKSQSKFDFGHNTGISTQRHLRAVFLQEADLHIFNFLWDLEIILFLKSA